jgi:hypothetical protein
VGGHNPQFINHVGEERRPVAPFGGAAGERPLLTAASGESLSGGIKTISYYWPCHNGAIVCQAVSAPELQEDAGQVTFTSAHAWGSSTLQLVRNSGWLLRLEPARRKFIVLVPENSRYSRVILKPASLRGRFSKINPVC